MKLLIVFYSRKGVTRRLAHRLAEAFAGHDCCIEQIIDLNDRSGPIGFLRSGYDSLFGRLTRIESPTEYPSDYDLVLIGTPVWTGALTPAIRTYLSQFGGSSKNVAYFCTFGLAGYKKVFRGLRKFFKFEPIAQLALKNHQVKTEQFTEQVNEFAAKIISALDGGGN